MKKINHIIKIKKIVTKLKYVADYIMLYVPVKK